MFLFQYIGISFMLILSVLTENTASPNGFHKTSCRYSNIRYNHTGCSCVIQTLH